MPDIPPVPAVSAGHRLVVLPLANFSPDASDEYFADGMTEELISALSKISAIKVIARTSAMRFKGAQKGVAEIGRELNVRSVLEGSVRKAGDRIRINVQLVDAASEEQIWSQEYDRELADVFQIQREISKRIARSLRVHIRSQEDSQLSKAATSDVGAYALYLRGRFHWNQRTSAGLTQAATFFREALTMDPKFALAETGVADSFAALALLEFSPPSDAFPRARAAAERALAQDANLAEAHASLGLVQFQYDRDWKSAEASFQRAINLNPNYPAAHQYFADYLKAMGRFDEALDEMRRAGELDPLSLAIATGVGHVLYLSRKYDAAIEQYRKATTLDPSFIQAHLWFGRPYLEKGMYTEAIAELRQAVELSGGSTISVAVLAHAYASSGEVAEARKLLDQLLERAKERYLPSYWVALVYTGLGEVDVALQWLDRAYEERSSWLVWIGVEPRFDRLRTSPRFHSLLRRMNLVDRAVPGSWGPSGSVDPATTSWLEALEELRTSPYEVVGGYTRFDPTARHLLKDLRQKITARLSGGSPRIENFLIWSPPGGGKSFFVQEIGRSLAGRATFSEINLAALDEAGYRSALARVTSQTTPTLCLLDEVDSRPSESWPYEAMIPEIEPQGSRTSPVAFVLAGSTLGGLAELRSAIQARPKGSDLLSRIPESNAYAIPRMSGADRAIVAVGIVRTLARRSERVVAEVEKLALYYLLADPELESPRQLRDFLSRASERIPDGEERLKFDHLFDHGDPRNKEFWLLARERAPKLAGSYLRISD